MAKIIPSKISKSERTKLANLLFLKISKLRSKKEVSNFMQDVFTESEIIMSIRRLEIAKMLLDGYSYPQIRNKLGVGYDTIRTVRFKIENGSGGFLKFIKQLKI